MGNLEWYLQIGICGDHCGDSDSIHFFNALNVDYLSALPDEISVAKIAAAQAHIKASASECVILRCIHDLM
jgi:pyruvate,orthophosphate dikinase